MQTQKSLNNISHSFLTPKADRVTCRSQKGFSVTKEGALSYKGLSNALYNQLWMEQNSSGAFSCLQADEQIKLQSLAQGLVLFLHLEHDRRNVLQPHTLI